APTAPPSSSRPELTEPSPAWEPPLVGRQPNVARLRKALDEALAGRGRVVVLIGEAGAGKSRLVSELTASAARRRWRVMVGRGYETERIRPCAPWVAALRSGRVVEEREILDTLEPGWRDELERLLPELSGQGKPTASSPGEEVAGRSGGDPRYPFEAATRRLQRRPRPGPPPAAPAGAP